MRYYYYYYYYYLSLHSRSRECVSYTDAPAHTGPKHSANFIIILINGVNPGPGLWIFPGQAIRGLGISCTPAGTEALTSAVAHNHPHCHFRRCRMAQQ